ncbi:terpenoid synthase [Lactarius hatsudake]|nr:terpenoid synthase [Lactarius hatsudake]
MSERYYIPVNLDKWKWPRRINPHYAEEAYDRSGLRTGCDLINVLFVFDEYTDVVREEEVQVRANIGVDALRNPHKPRPKDEWIGGEMTRRFWELAINTASAQAQKRFIETFDAYLQAVDDLAIRRDTTASKPCFAVLESDMNLPEEAVHHPVIEELYILSIDVILLDNVTITTIVMHHNETDIQGAMNRVYDYHKEREAKTRPKFGEPADTELVQNVEGLGNWVTAGDQWGFESERYFGKKGPEIKKTKQNKKNMIRSEDIGMQFVDDSLQ